MDKVGFSFSISIEMVPEQVMVSCVFCGAKEVVADSLDSRRGPLREEPERTVFVAVSVRVGKFAGERGEVGSGESGGRMGGGSPVMNARGFTSEA